MPVNQKLQELIDRWEDLQEQGQDVPAKDLCRDHPELLEELERRIKALKAMSWLADSDSSGDADNEQEAEQSVEQLPHTLGGRYRLDELVGVGGFGQVWRGYDPELQRVVAIKIPRSGHVTPQQIAALRDEATKVANLKHQGIVPVHDVGQEGEFYFIVSDFVDGGSLADRLKTGRLDWRESARVVGEIAEILAYAHRKGIIHRDIKPANILLDRQGKAYLTDFGIAISSEERQVGKTSAQGTRAYMSPEQVRGTLAEIDARTDIYSLGVVLYQLLSGHLPFEARDGFDLRQALSAGTPPLAPIGQDIPPKLERICRRALEKDRAKRYATAEELTADLRNLVSPRRGKWLSMVGLVCLLIAVTLVLPSVLRPFKEQAVPQPKAEQIIETLKEYGKSHPIQPSNDKAMKDALKALHSVRAEMKKESGAIDASLDSTQAEHNKESSAFSMLATEIDLTGKKLTASDFERLSRLPVLQHLVLANTTTNDSNLSSLAGTPSLAILDLSGSRITDAGLKTISPMQLRVLDLSKTTIGDEGLSYLCDEYGVAGSINVLKLNGTGITDAGIPSLKKMTRLREIYLDGTKVTDRATKELRVSLPRCNIRHESGAKHTTR